MQSGSGVEGFYKSHRVTGRSACATKTYSAAEGGCGPQYSSTDKGVLSVEAVRRGSAASLPARIFSESVEISMVSVYLWSGSWQHSQTQGPSYSRADEVARSLKGCRDDGFRGIFLPQKTQKAPSFLMGPCEFNAATTYSPTHFRVQYNRPCGA